jgi:glucuronoarabinoxylan endo-1,4-beta-xylanase
MAVSVRRALSMAVCAAAGAIAGCGADRTSSAPPSPVHVVVDPSKRYQTIDGFGAADTWTPGGPLTADQAKLFFDPDAGIGLSLLRIGIEVDGGPLGDGTYSDIKAAASYGARVWATPWTPPASEKDNNDPNNGGHLCAAAGAACTGNDYDAWATVLAQFVADVQSQTQVPLYGISAQNEPDYTAPYASCLFTPDQMVAFINVLGPKLAGSNPPVKLIAPESQNWDDLWSDAAYGLAILNDPTAGHLVDILATHDYGLSPLAPPSGVTTPIWETEVSGLPPLGAPDLTIVNGLQVAGWVYDAIVDGGASAWHYWWLVSYNNNDNEGLLFEPGAGPGDAGDVGSPPKRLYAVGNFSKFVRPGAARVDVSGAPPGTRIAAFQDPTTNATAIVAINSGTADIAFTVTIAGSASTTAFTPWVTSATEDLAPQAPVGVDGGVFTATLPAQSVTTFVGQP